MQLVPPSHLHYGPRYVWERASLLPPSRRYLVVNKWVHQAEIWAGSARLYWSGVAPAKSGPKQA